MRHLNRIRKLPLALLAASLYNAQAQAATITVSASASDALVGIVEAVNGDALCSLIGAITNANANDQSGDTDCTAGSGDDTLVLPTGATFTLTTANSVDANAGDTGLPPITSTLTIEGNGSTITRSGANTFRIIRVSSGGNLTLDQVTVSNGAAYAGGGILNGSGGTLTLNQSTVSSNNSTNSGGGIYSGGTLTLNQSTVNGNTSTMSGGGISSQSATLTLNNSTVSGNSAPHSGGGLYTFMGFSNPTTLNNVTVSGNSSVSGTGGGMNIVGFGTATLKNTLVAGNTAISRAEIYLDDSYATLSINANNLFGHSGLTNAQAFNSAVTPGASDRRATVDGNVPKALSSILNTTLASNGGPTQTHALVSGSPAVNASGTGATTTDQRGFEKAAGDTVRDIGAFELNGVAPAPPVVAVNGACGSANASATSLAPTGTALCTTGTATTIVGDEGAWRWSCTGSNGGTTSTCAAPYASQTLTLTVSPTSITVGNAASASAQSTSALKPVLSTSTPTVCEVGTAMNSSTGVQAMVGGNAAGTCTVLANHPGTGDIGEARFLPAPQVSATLTVTAAPPAGGSACEAFATGTANVIDLRSSPGGATARGVNGRFNVIYGSAFADNLTGGNAGNCIDGGAGNDRLTAGAGANHLYGSDGNDTLTPAGGSNAMDGGPGTDKCGKASSRATASYTSCESN